MKLFLLLSAGGLLLAFPTARAEIHIGDPYVRAALEDYAKFAEAPAGASRKPSKVSPPTPLARETLKVTAAAVAGERKKTSW